MHSNQEWRYQVLFHLDFQILNHFQVDLYALGMSLHVIMFGDYSKIDKKSIKNGRVPVNFGIPRHFDRSTWKTVFDSLLNHDGLGDGLEKFRSARDHCTYQYQLLDKRDKKSFGVQYSSYLASQ